MTRKIDPREQFSKKLAKWSSIFWFFYMTVLAAVLLVEPSSSDAAVYMSITVSAVMAVNVFSYTRNSIYEKALYALVDMEKVKRTWKGSAGDDSIIDDEPIAEDGQYEDEEGGSNG